MNMAVAPRISDRGRRVAIGLGVAVALGTLAGATAWAEPCGPNHVDRYNAAADRFECIPFSESLRSREQLNQEQKARQRQQTAAQGQLQRDQGTLTRRLKAEQRQTSGERRTGQLEAGQQREIESRALDQNQKRLRDQLRLQQKPGL